MGNSSSAENKAANSQLRLKLHELGDLAYLLGDKDVGDFLKSVKSPADISSLRTAIVARINRSEDDDSSKLFFNDFSIDGEKLTEKEISRLISGTRNWKLNGDTLKIVGHNVSEWAGNPLTIFPPQCSSIVRDAVKDIENIDHCCPARRKVRQVQLNDELDKTEKNLRSTYKKNHRRGHKGLNEVKKLRSQALDIMVRRGWAGLSPQEFKKKQAGLARYCRGGKRWAQIGHRMLALKNTHQSFEQTRWSKRELRAVLSYFSFIFPGELLENCEVAYEGVTKVLIESTKQDREATPIPTTNKRARRSEQQVEEEYSQDTEMACCQNSTHIDPFTDSDPPGNLHPINDHQNTTNVVSGNTQPIGISAEVLPRNQQTGLQSCPHQSSRHSRQHDHHISVTHEIENERVGSPDSGSHIGPSRNDGNITHSCSSSSQGHRIDTDSIGRSMTDSTFYPRLPASSTSNMQPGNISAGQAMQPPAHGSSFNSAIDAHLQTALSEYHSHAIPQADGSLSGYFDPSRYMQLGNQTMHYFDPSRFMQLGNLSDLQMHYFGPSQSMQLGNLLNPQTQGRNQTMPFDPSSYMQAGNLSNPQTEEENQTMHFDSSSYMQAGNLSNSQTNPSLFLRAS